MPEKKQTDSKSIEEKAILSFKLYLEDSKTISTYLTENDREPCWDGHLYLYNENEINKDNLNGRIPIQIKGIEVNEFKLSKFKYPIDVNDIKAYLHEPTVYVVCQEKRNSKERSLFYRCLLPETIKNIIKGKEQQKSIMVLMHRIPQELDKFENQMFMFLSDSIKQLSFADNPNRLTIEQVIKSGVNSFTCSVPKSLNIVNVLGYLSTTPTYLYAKINSEFNIEMPISNGPMLFNFMQNIKRSIKVGEKEYFDTYSTKIEKGILFINIGNVFNIIQHLDNNVNKKYKIKIDCHFEYLKDSINKAEFLIAAQQSGTIKIGDYNFAINIDGQGTMERLHSFLQDWIKFQNFLDKLHVTKDMIIKDISEEQNLHMDNLLKAINEQKAIKLDYKENTIALLELSNIKVLAFVTVGEDGLCKVIDFFNPLLKMMGDNKKEVSPFSYLTWNDLWGKCDNIPFDDIIPSYKEKAKEGSKIYNIANWDLLSILGAYDSIKTRDQIRATNLLKAAININVWLIDNAPKKSKIIHEINRYQIIKRQRNFTEEEKDRLLSLLSDQKVLPLNKAGICILLEDNETFKKWINKCSPKEKKGIKTYPIWNLKK